MSIYFWSFNAARGFVGGAAQNRKEAIWNTACFNAARGFVGGAAGKKSQRSSGARPFQCRTRLCGWCSPEQGIFSFIVTEFQCRTRLCGWCNGSALRRALLRRRVSMPHAALWVVQLGIGTKHFTKLIGFNAARGFVGGATIYDVNSCITGIRFQCRTRLCGWCNPLIARLDKQVSAVSMPHAALWVVQRSKKEKSLWRIISFNAARGFVGGATGIAYMLFALSNVSMPHAALWVVQLAWQDSVFLFQRSFNAARGFVGGATSEQVAEWRSSSMFQCRTRLCGWCNRRFANLWRHNSAVSMPHAALWVVQPHRSQPLSPYGEKALLESLRKFEMSDGKYVKYLFLFSCSLRRNPLRDQHLARP